MKVKEFRKKHNMTQTDLADILGISRPTLINIEKGERNLKRRELDKLKAIENESELVDKDVMQFVQLYDDVSISELEDVLETLHDFKLLNDKGEDFWFRFWRTFKKCSCGPDDGCSKCGKA